MAIQSQKKKIDKEHIVRIFTDGACSGNPGVGGWASIIFSNKKMYQKSGYELHTTNNRMEVIAVIEGLKVAKKKKMKHVQIHSDSAYVINAFEKGWILTWRMNNWKKSDGSDVKNSDLWKELYSLKNEFSTLSFHKVKGHSGDYFNELADALAKEEVKVGRALRSGHSS